MAEEIVGQQPSGEEQIVEQPPEQQDAEQPEEIMQPGSEEPGEQEELSHSEKSWLGRKLKGVEDKLARQIREENQRLLQQMVQYIPQPQQTPQTPQPDPTDFDPYNPQQVLTLFDQHQQRKQSEQNQYKNTVSRNLQYSITTDPDLSGDSALANEVMQLATQVTLLPNAQPQVQAEYLKSVAKANVLARKVKEKVNPFHGKAPADQPIGSVTPSFTLPKKAVKLPPLSDETKKLQRIWGFSDEKMSEILSQ
uniref:Uncharacterized protein n=1 Tax=viral metagenome TaxID=1070528 RepID=A0A6M3J987_9ZZZZ